MSLRYSFSKVCAPYSGCPWKWTNRLFFFFFTNKSTPGFRRLGEDSVTSRRAAHRSHFVPSRMRKAHLVGYLAGQRVVALLGGIKHAEFLVRQPVTFDAIAVENAGMRRQTGQDCRNRVPLGPVENLGQKSQYGSSRRLG